MELSTRLNWNNIQDSYENYEAVKPDGLFYRVRQNGSGYELTLESESGLLKLFINDSIDKFELMDEANELENQRG